MLPDYKNWMPMKLIKGLFLCTVVLFVLLLYIYNGTALAGSYRYAATGICAVLFLIAGAAFCWAVLARRAFSYSGDRQLMKRTVEGIAAYVQIPAGGTGLDVGCGSGALTIACAKRNPQGHMVGVDIWGWPYSGSFSKALCEENARAEGTANVRFQQGDAKELPFPDETFDVVVSNYVYHDVYGTNRRELLKETLRVLKKGGTFAIHDLMSSSLYGNMEEFTEELRRDGYEHVECRNTANGLFAKRREAVLLRLGDSTLLTGKK